MTIGELLKDYRINKVKLKENLLLELLVSHIIQKLKRRYIELPQMICWKF